MLAGAAMTAMARAAAVPAVLPLLLLPLLGVVAKGERLIYSDEFNTLDQSKWGHLVTAWRGGNDEFQYYRNSRTNSYVRNGILYLRPTLTADEYGENFVQHGKLSYPDCNMDPCVSQAGSEVVQPVLSARISTHEKFSFKYGRLEVRAKLPRGDWIWPAIWLMPESDVFGGWPRSGEIDLMESRGNANLTNAAGEQQGLRRVGSTLHFGPSPSEDGFRAASYSKTMNSDTLADDFHVYTLEWDETGFNFRLDGQLIGHHPAPDGSFWKLGNFKGNDIWKGQHMAPFNQNFYIMMNVAVGGNYFDDSLINYPHPRPWNMSSGKAMRQFWEKRDEWKNTWQGEKAALQVDYVRVYQN